MKELKLLQIFGKQLSAMEEKKIAEELKKNPKIREYVVNDIGVGSWSNEKLAHVFCEYYGDELDEFIIMGDDLYSVSVKNLTHDPEEVELIEKVNDGSICVYRGRLADGRWFWGTSDPDEKADDHAEILDFCPFDWEWYEMCDITTEDVVGHTKHTLETLWEKTPKNRRKERNER